MLSTPSKLMRSSSVILKFGHEVDLLPKIDAWLAPKLLKSVTHRTINEHYSG